jgi:hypothetical protein
MTSGKPRRITWPRLCHPFRSDDFCMRPHCNQFSSCPKIFLQRQSLDRLHLRLNYLLIQPLLFLSQSEGPIAQGHYRWPLAKFGETIAKKFTRMGSDWRFRFSRPTQYVKYMFYPPPLRQSCSSQYCTLALFLIDANHKDLFCQDQLSPCLHRVHAQVR